MQSQGPAGLGVRVSYSASTCPGDSLSLIPHLSWGQTPIVPALLNAVPHRMSEPGCAPSSAGGRAATCHCTAATAAATSSGHNTR